VRGRYPALRTAADIERRIGRRCGQVPTELTTHSDSNTRATSPAVITDKVRQRADPNKSAENKRKHGIDFEEAQELWADSGLVEIPARTTDEPRWLLVGKIDQKHWSAVVTRRGENVRLISVRRSRDEEVTIYESQDI
jgi:uncharacterized DUF497 family protein